MDKYQTLLAELQEKTKLAHRIVEDKPDLNWTTEEVEKFQQDQKELEDIGKQLDPLKKIHDAAESQRRRMEEWNTPVDRVGFGMPGDGKPGEEKAPRTLGEMFIATPEYKAGQHQSNPRINVTIPGVTLIDHKQARDRQQDAEFKTTITAGSSYAPFVTRRPRMIEFAIRRTTVGDLMPNTAITESSVKYMEETTFTNNAAAVAENAAKPESALAWTERTAPVEVIAHYIPVTEQILRYESRMRSMIDNRLVVMLELAEENALLNGNGTPPQIMGFYNKPSVQTQSGAGIEIVEAIYKAFTKVRSTGFAEPDAVVIHPNDWEAVRLMRADGATGVYLFGNPSEAGPETIWGKQTAITTAATENTALTGDFGLYSELFRNGGIRVEVDRINDDFIKNKLTVRAEEYITLAIYRATAFCLVTNI